MQNTKCLMHSLPGCLVAGLALFLFAGCKSEQSAGNMTSAAPAATVAPAAVPAQPATPAPVAPPVRIKAGLTTAFTDSEGNVWLPDQGFVDGDTIERSSDLQIANTKDPGLYLTERYGMTSFSYPVPNGKYIVKLHFAETYEGISGPGERVFSFNVAGHPFNDFDVWVKAGDHNRAYIETVNVEVTNGKLDITFTPKVENPEINGIEILPAS
ncbi:MAG: malectin [Verrucomicrobiia bacterium]